MTASDFSTPEIVQELLRRYPRLLIYNHNLHAAPPNNLFQELLRRGYTVTYPEDGGEAVYVEAALKACEEGK